MNMVDKNCMDDFCLLIKNKVNNGEYDDCFRLIYEKMAEYPHNPEPHNLLGILLEIKGNHLLAMKHLRVAWALDPSYIPSNRNLENLASIFIKKSYVFE